VIRSIVLPLDGSDLAARAVPFAVYLARRTRAALVLLRATEHVNPAFVHHPEALTTAAVHERAARRKAAGDLWTLAEPLRKEGIMAHVTLASGVAEQAIMDATRARPASLIVMATHGTGGLASLTYGSVADAVLHQTPVPVLLVSAACDRHWPEDRPLRVLVPLDGSEVAETILGPVGALGRVLSLEFTLLRVVGPGARDSSADCEVSRSYLQAVRTRLGIRGVSATHVVVGDPAESIDAVARQRDADLIAMGTHGRGGVARAVLGSVAEQTLRRVGVPLLLVRPHADLDAA